MFENKPKIFIIEKTCLLNKKRTILNKNFKEDETKASNEITQYKKYIEYNYNSLNEMNPGTREIEKSNEYDNINENVKKRKWTKTEDMLLMKNILKYGVGNWNIIEKNFRGKDRKQIRQRYINYLKTINKIHVEGELISFIEDKNNNNNNNINSNISLNNKKNLEAQNQKLNFVWNDTLDKLLLKEYLLNKKCWVKISEKIRGSTQNSVKNRFYSLLRQKVNKKKKENNFSTILDDKKEKTEYILKAEKVIGIIKNNETEIYKIIKNDNEIIDDNILVNKSKKKNYTIKILLEFLPELLEEKKIDLDEIILEFEKRKKIAVQKIVFIIENHFYYYTYLNLSNNDEYTQLSTTTDESDVSKDLYDFQMEKLGNVVKNMKLKIMHKYFHQFRRNTLGI